MRKGFLGSMALALLLPVLARAQNEPTVPAVPVAVEPSVPMVFVDGGEEAGVPGFWFNADYLLWWTKSSPTPGPLITTGSLNDAIPGGVGQPGTTVVFGNNNFDTNTKAGMRLAAGFWLGSAQRFGIEGTWLQLEKRTQAFSIASDAAGNPLIGRAIISPFTGDEIIEADAIPDLLTGGAAASFSTRLLGWELNSALNVTRRRSLALDLLAGFRALDLHESLILQDSFTPLVAGVTTFNGLPADPPSSLGDFDSFHTSNKFYGPQIGSRIDWNSGRFNVNVITKVALGTTQQDVDIDGASVLITPGAATVTAAGGVLAAPSNIGHYYREQFTVVPEVGLNAGFALTDWLRLRAGYTFMYWSSVVRPGNTVDRTVNFTQLPTDFSFVPGPANPAVPAFSFQRSDYWAQGFNFGLELSY